MLRTPRVLVVDDTRLYRRIAKELLEQDGLRVIEASTGEDGLAIAGQESPDLILLDMTMPGLDGIETCRRLKVAPETQNIPVIFFSALSEVDEVVRGLEAGALDYITKPFRPAELLARVRAHVRLKMLQDERLMLYRQIEAELARAGQVQAELLSLIPPTLAGFELAAQCVPAREVGGDFYTWNESAPGLLNLTVGDVMGKGMPAALLMATVRSAIHVASRRHPPGATIDLTAHALQADLERSSSFVTLFHAQLDSAAGQLSYVDAGHGHVFLRRADGEVQMLTPRGLPLGVLAEQTYQEGVVSLRVGDALIIYSDGFIDARPDLAVEPGDVSGQLQGCHSAADMVESLLNYAAPVGPPPDDLTVLVVYCNGRA